MTKTDNLLSLSNAVLGETAGKLHLYGVSECKEAALSLASQSKRSIYIFSYDLDSKLYDNTEFLEAVRELVIHSDHSHIKVLLQNNEKVQREGHRLIQLWRRLTSKIEIKKPPADYIGHPDNFLLADEIGFLHRKSYTEYDATADFNAGLKAKRLSMFFEEVWEQSEPDSELRSLHI